jgi:hypothetical protein
MQKGEELFNTAAEENTHPDSHSESVRASGMKYVRENSRAGIQATLVKQGAEDRYFHPSQSQEIDMVVSPEQGDVVMRIADFICKRIEDSANRMMADMTAGLPKKKFSAYLTEDAAWTRVRPHVYRLPKDLFPPEAATFEVHLRDIMGGGRVDVDDEGRVMHLNLDIMGFDTASSTERIRDFLRKIRSNVHHESEHLYYLGTEYDAAAPMLYLASPGEIRAYARQSAQLYAESFPGESFQLPKMQQMVDGFTLRNEHPLRRYWLDCPQIDVRTVSSHSESLRHVMIKLTSGFLEQYNTFRTS